LNGGIVIQGKGGLHESDVVLSTNPNSSPMISSLAFRTKLGDDVMRILRNGILNGTYRAGFRMAPLQLAEAIGVSTMPVREALVRLANEGLVEVLPRRGFRVAHLNRRDVADAFEVHAMVAGALAAEAASMIRDSQLRPLREVQAQLEAKARLATSSSPGYASEVEELNWRFHRLINHIPPAPRLRWFLRATVHFVPSHCEFIPGWIQASVSDHPAIIERLELHDPEGTRRVVQNHYRHAAALATSHIFASDSLLAMEDGA
jgi:DNA-binding GntR family transcriptional regulator